MQPILSFGRLLIALSLLCTAGLAGAATVSWSIIITPSGGGTVEWKTSSPAASGTLTKSGSVKFNSGAYVDLTFKAKNGYQLTGVLKNTDQWINYLDSNKHFQFGPVSKAHVITAIFSVVNPTGSFDLVFPDGKAGSVVDVTGNYSGTTTTKSHRKYNVDVAMDEAGKLSAMGTVDGIAPKGGGAIQGTVGSVKTTSGKPTAQLKGSFNGTQDGVATTASGNMSGPIALKDAGAGNSTVTGVGSGTAKVGKTSYTRKTTTTNFIVSAAQAANLSDGWDLALTIREITDARTGKKSLAASSILTLPSGDRTSFKEKAVTYAPDKGLSVAFSSGVKLDSAGNPILDPKTKKPVIDTKSSVSLTGMLLTGSTGHWVVTGGKVGYKFLGQSGSGGAMDFTGPEETVFNNGNIYAVANNPTAATVFTISKAYAITYFTTYHWNYGQGTKTPGQLSLKHQDGTVYGPWRATGKPGQGGVKNAVWECLPMTMIKAGTYTVIDSDPTTWAQNSASGGRGFAEIHGKP